MRILELTAKNYGVWRNSRFGFGDGGFALVHGPNETGKSTLLQLLRELLFGFPHVSPFAFEQGEKMSAEVEAELRDGRKLSFLRQKKRVDTVAGELEGEVNKIDEAKLLSLLSHATPSLYRNVFAFSLTELAVGVDSFKDAGLTLTEALFGGALGGIAHLPKVKRQLRAEHEGLFKPAARNPPINDLIRTIKEKRRLLREAAIKPARYSELRDQQARTAEDIAVKQARLKDEEAALARLRRLEKAWTPWLEAEAVRQQLATLDVPAALRPGDAERFEKLAVDAEELASQCEQLRAAVARNEAECAGLSCDASLLARRGEITHLERELGKIEACLRDLPLRAQERADCEAKLAALLAGIDPTWKLADLTSLELNLDQRERLRTLGERWPLLQAELETSREDHRLAAEAVARQEAKLAALAPEVAHDALAAALAGQMDFASARQTIKDTEKRVALLASEQHRLKVRLAATVPAAQAIDLAAIEPPLEEVVTDYRERLTALERDVAKASERREHLLAAKEANDEALHGLESTGAIPDQAALAAARRRRDEGWKLIRRHYIEQSECDKRIAAWLADPLGSLPEEFLQSQHAADGLADERLRLADAVARKEQLLREREALAAKLAQEESAWVGQTAALKELQQRWRALWTPCGIDPHAPAAMLAWLSLLAQWRKNDSELGEAQRARAEAQRAHDAFERRLREALADETTPLDRLLHHARAKDESAKQSAGREASLAETLAETRVHERKLAELCTRLAAEETAWQASWSKLLAQLALPQDWQVAAIGQLLSAVDQAQSLVREAERLRRRIDDMTRERDDFDQTSAALAAALCPDLAEQFMIERVRALAERGQKAHDAAQRSTSLAEERGRLDRELAGKLQRLEQSSAAQAELLNTVGATDAVEFHRLTRDAAQRDKLLDALRLAERALAVAREREDEREFHDRLAVLESDGLRLATSAAEAKVAEIQRELDELQQQSGGLRREMEELYQEGQSLVLQQQIERCRGELKEHVERWATLAMGERLLELSLARFQRESKDHVLGDARRLFMQLTHGRHVDIQQGLDDALRLVGADGVERAPEELSRGTQEQLYLAFRLAYVRHYCREREPLPFVMDDVLVNFDDERRADTIEALLELSRDVQVIFLTCHASTVELVQRCAPNCTTIDLAAAREAAAV